METFIEYFEKFKKECSYETLFFNGLINEQKNKLERNRTFTISIITIIFYLILLYKTPKYIPIYTTIILIIYLLKFLCDTKRKRKYLKERGFPIPFEFYKWESTELEIMRLKKTYKTYQKINSTTISKLIEIANNQLNKDSTKSFIVFEKVSGYFGGIFFNFLLGFYMASIQVDLVKNLEYYLILFIKIFSISIFIVASYHFTKNGHLLDEKSNKRQLNDYIFVLENILLIKDSESKSKTKT